MEKRCSPSLPFVTSSTTSDREATKIAKALFELFRDPLTAQIRDALELADISIPDDAAYDRLALLEREAAALGYAEIRSRRWRESNAPVVRQEHRVFRIARNLRTACSSLSDLWKPLIGESA